MQMILFALATLTPALLIGRGVDAGGVWPWLALGYMTVFAATMDRFVPRFLPEAPEAAEFPSGKGLSVVLGLVHLVLLPAVVAMAASRDAGLSEKLVTLIAAGLWFGQVSHPNAHELIHRPERAARYLGRLVYGTLLFGHHASAHLLVHHVHVATNADPNSAPRGMGFWRFFGRAWRGSFKAGLAAENALRARAARPSGTWSHPYLGYVLTGLLCLGASFIAFGIKGLAAYLALCLYAQVQILLADYVQHYGLRRGLRANGKPAPVGDGHSWNSPHWFGSAVMVNAPRHSDHHLHPGRPYPALRLRADMPIWPHSLPVMAAIALLPPLWRRVMARALNRLPESAGDT